MNKLLLFSVLGLLLVGGVFLYNSPIWENQKIECNRFDSNGVRIVCGGEDFREYNPNVIKENPIERNN